MTSITLSIAVIGYVLATVLTVRCVRLPSLDSDNAAAPSIKLAFSVGIFAALCHLGYASQVSFVDGKLNLALNSMAVLISGILVCLYVLGGLIMPIKRLGILVFPIIIASLTFAALWPDAAINGLSQRSQEFNIHILISILAFAVLAIAAIQAVLYAYQEKQLRQRTNPALLMALAPLQTMELLLFRLAGVGFVLLTLTLVSGAIFSREIFGHAFEFKHHTILATLGWLVFAVLLYKRTYHGLRGSQAVKWTISGFILITLGYFGTKMISESLAFV